MVCASMDLGGEVYIWARLMKNRDSDRERMEAYTSHSRTQTAAEHHRNSINIEQHHKPASSSTACMQHSQHSALFRLNKGLSIVMCKPSTHQSAQRLRIASSAISRHDIPRISLQQRKLSHPTSRLVLLSSTNNAAYLEYQYFSIKDNSA